MKQSNGIKRRSRVNRVFSSVCNSGLRIKRFWFSEKSDRLFFTSVKNPHSNTAIIFLHGIAASRNSWGNEYEALSSKYSLYFVDLLGFGFSQKPKTDYTLALHVAEIKKFIDREVTEKYIIFIGHSMGSIVALGYANMYPERIKKLILLSLPYYPSEAEARRDVASALKLKWKKLAVTDSRLTKIICTTFCLINGPITRQIVPFFFKNHPRKVAQDGFRHTYNSYMSSLIEVIYKQDVPSLLNSKTLKKITLLHGTEDKNAPYRHVVELADRFKLQLVSLQNVKHNVNLVASETIRSLV